MSHKLFCDIGGHELECDCVALHEFVPEKYSVCICKSCHLPMDEGDHLGCEIAVVTCSEHQASEMENAGGVRINIPPDAVEKADRAVSQLETYAAACFWCGHGYDECSPELEDEHFAYHCPDAPEKLRENAKRRLLRDGEGRVQ